MVLPSRVVVFVLAALFSAVVPARAAPVFRPAQAVAVPAAAAPGAFVEDAAPDPSGFLVVTAPTVTHASGNRAVPFWRVSASGAGSPLTTVTETSLIFPINMAQVTLAGFRIARDGMLQWETDEYLYDETGITPRELSDHTVHWADVRDGMTRYYERHHAVGGFEAISTGVSSGTLDIHGHWVFVTAATSSVYTSQTSSTVILNGAHSAQWSRPGSMPGAQLLAGRDSAPVAVDGADGVFTETVFSADPQTSRTVVSFGDTALRRVVACGSDAATSVVVYVAPSGDLRAWRRNNAAVHDILLDAAAPFATADRVPCGFDPAGALHAFFLSAARNRILLVPPVGAMLWLDPAALAGSGTLAAWSLDDPACPQAVVSAPDGALAYLEYDGTQWTASQVAPAPAPNRYANVRVGTSLAAGRMVTWQLQRPAGTNWVHDSTWQRSTGSLTRADSEWAILE